MPACTPTAKYDGTDRTPFIFVGNNAYETTGLDIGERRRLDGGKLWVCRAPGADRAALIKMAVRAVLGRASPGELKVLEAEELWVQTQAGQKHEGRQRRRGVLHRHPPLHYRIRPKALRVIVPAGKNQDA